jgi:sugar/nucleoside kinase (ribokinase family)
MNPYKLMRYASWSIIIDDIVFPDGRTAMGVLGGGGLYTVTGMRVWTEDAGVLANVGADFDPARLAAQGLSADGLLVTERPTPRAWQLFETDGHRTQIPRVPIEDWTAQLRRADDLPDRLAALGVRAFHLLSPGHPTDPALAARMAGMGIRLSLEPIIEEGMTREQRDRVLACLPNVEIFSPGVAETRVLLGERPLGEALRAFADLGPQIVALRRGAAGSLVYHHESRRMLRAPAARAEIVDLTGAGNAFCGGLLVGWVEHARLEQAAAYAAISAARALEQIGPPQITPALTARAAQQLPDVLATLQEVDPTSPG